LRLIIRREAEADIAEAFHWYERKREGLGDEFLEEVSKAINALHVEPLRFAEVFRYLRRANVHRFPYGVFFVIRDTVVVVVAVFHFGRSPRRLKTRAQPD
jgi:toxin ParE1/3/4